jgi:hypothetical protein
MNGWNIGAALLSLACLGATTFAGGINISEIRVNEPGIDANDFIELDGPPSTSVNGLTYVVIGRGDAITANGVIEHVYPLTGQVNAGGHFVAAGFGYSLSAIDLTIADFEFFSSDNKTHLLVTGFSGSVGQDLDTNENGTLNITPWTGVIDSVALVQTSDPPTGSPSNSFVYSDTSVGPDGAFLPGHVYVCADTGEWAVGLFDVGLTDRPQQINLDCIIEVPNVRINEVRVDQTGTDNEESFELKGPPSQSLDGLTYIVLGDGAGGNGVIETVVPLFGLQIPADGHFLAVESTHAFAPFSQVDLALTGNALNFENDDNVTHILVAGFTGANGQDLDTDDDGTLDETPWQAIVDLVAIIKQPNPPTGTEFHYAQNTDQIVGPDIDDGSPMHVFRCEPDGTWTIGAEDINISDTYGTLNLSCAGDVCGQPGAGDCFAANGTPGCNDSTCCNLVCAIDPSCCTIVWDAMCAQLAEFECEGGDPCGNPNAGSCFTPHEARGCDNEACCEVVCAIDPTCCTIEWDAPCVALAQRNCLVGGPPPNVRINEIRTDEPGANANEYFEIKGPASTSLAGVAYIVIGDGAEGDNGVIESVSHLTGNTIPGDGHFLAAEDNNTLGAAANAIVILNFENDDNVTHMLVFNFTGSLGDDLDGDDNGTFDVTPWSAVIDSIALLDSALPPAEGEDWAYGAATLGPVGGFAPAHAYRCETAGTWVAGRFDWDENNDTIPDGADTPGVINLTCAPASCGNPFAGDCFSANGTPGCEIADCCNEVCANDPYCCQVAWDDACAAQAAVTCGDPCGGPNAENCFAVNSTGDGGCDNPVCCNTVCSIDPTCCSDAWDAICVTIANDNCLFGGAAPNVRLNEMRLDQPGSDNDEYVEIKGAPGTTLNGVHLIAIGDGTGGSGIIEAWVDFSGNTIPADGHFLVAEATFSLASLGNVNLLLPNSDSGNAYGLNLENSDNVTFMLVYDFTGSIDVDVDMRDDGVIDASPPWSSVIDSIALVENTDMPPTGTEWWYGPFVGPDDVFVPGHAFRCETAGTWTVGAFDPIGGDDTPGILNPECGATTCTGDIVNSGTFAPPPDGQVDAADLAFLLGDWGPNPGSPADFVNSGTFMPPPDGTVDAADLAVLLGAWGPCP